MAIVARIYAESDTLGLYDPESGQSSPQSSVKNENHADQIFNLFLYSYIFIVFGPKSDEEIKNSLEKVKK